MKLCPVTKQMDVLDLDQHRKCEDEKHDGEINPCCWDCCWVCQEECAEPKATQAIPQLNITNPYALGERPDRPGGEE